MSTPLLDQALTLLATPEPFRQWLRGLDVHTAGLAGSGLECPIHNFLKENGIDVFVGRGIIKQGEGDANRVIIPQWAARHIEECDAIFPYRSNIPGWQALEYLDKVAPPAQGESVPESEGVEEPAPSREDRWMSYRAAYTAYTNALQSAREHDLLLAMMRRENARRHEEMTAALDAWLAAKETLDPADKPFVELTLQ